jgi:hypothetical protein
MHAWESSASWFCQLIRVRHICAARGISLASSITQPLKRASILDTEAEIPLLLDGLKDRESVAVRLADRTFVYLQRADLECLPMRLWLFGHVSCFERCLVDLVRRDYPQQDFLRVLTAERFAAAQRLFHARVGRHETLDLADCLQIADKRELLLAERAAAKRLGFASKKQAKKFFEHVETLRDRLAHAHDLVPDSDWSTFIHLSLRLVKFLQQCTVSQLNE